MLEESPADELEGKYQFAAMIGLLRICFLDFSFCRFLGTLERFFLLCIGRAIASAVCIELILAHLLSED
jgi:hypothetical protein